MKTPLELNVRTVHQMQTDGEDFLLIDCREPDENEACNIEGDKLIPMGDTLSRLDELVEYKDKPIVVY